MNANQLTLECRHSSMGLWLVLSLGVISGMLMGVAGLLLGFAALLTIKSYLIG